VRFIFDDKKLRALYEKLEGAAKYPPAVVDAFFEVMSVIAAAANENDLRQLKSLRFEKLKGKRGHLDERSLRLNDQHRLIVRIERDDQGRFLLIISIEDYH
jgi:proteic killer suppression protein